VRAEATPRSIACIINGAAGAREVLSTKTKVAELFEAKGTDVQIFVAQKGKQIPGFVRQALAEGARTVVAAGGDGTVNAVASVLVGSNATLGVLPLGTLNHFAQDVGVPLELEAAVETVLTGAVIRVDAGSVNGKIFLNNSSLGLYPAIVRKREDFQKKGHGKWWAFAVATFITLRRYQRLYVKLQTEAGEEVEEETPFVFIGNNQYEVSGLQIGTRFCLDAGMLSVYRAPSASRLSLFRMAFHALLGRREPGTLAEMKAVKFCIRGAKSHIHVATDGEVERMRGPLNYSIMPKVIGVIVPATKNSASQE